VKCECPPWLRGDSRGFVKRDLRLSPGLLTKPYQGGERKLNSFTAPLPSVASGTLSLTGARRVKRVGRGTRKESLAAAG
jgi:hypothetical protein